MGGYRISQAIYAVAALGIPDLLAGGPRASDELARATGLHADTLYRVLRVLVGVELFDETAPRQFGLTPLGNLLRTEAPGSLRWRALMNLDPPKWLAWGDLLHSLRTGEAAFPHVHGMEYFDYLHTHPEATKIFQDAMTSNTAPLGAAMTRAYDFTDVRRLVDVGGGHGVFLATILHASPVLQGVLFDRPEVVACASALLGAAGIAERCEVLSGDFFASVPADGDLYVLRRILHDWDDARATQILANCRRAMGASGKVLVIESAIAPDYRQALPVLEVDLEMLVNLGGRQRTEAEYSALFAAAGFHLSAVIPLADAAPFSVFEGVPA